MSTRRAKAPAVPAIHPREKLTRKALAAISTYASAKCKLPLHHLMVVAVLEAERMPRARLYDWLYGRGYQWYPGSGIWKQSEKSTGSAAAVSDTGRQPQR